MLLGGKHLLHGANGNGQVHYLIQQGFIIMKQVKRNCLVLLCGTAALLSQTTAIAATEYIASGTFFGASLQVTEFDEETGDEIFVDAFLDQEPINFGPSSSFSLRFTVDETADGNVPLFANVALFDDAVSGVSFDINGNNVVSNATPDAAQQFPGNASLNLSSRWSWSLFDESLALPSVTVINNMNFETIADLTPQFAFFALYDSTRQVYGNSFPLDLINLDINEFDGNEFSLSWLLDSSGDNGPNNDFNGDASYTVFGRIDSFSSVSEVPIPAAAWLFGSALIGLATTKKNLSS